ncbi:MAG: hypothetical protein WC082_16120, partial [Victivallales bacterium]
PYAVAYGIVSVSADVHAAGFAHDFRAAVVIEGVGVARVIPAQKVNTRRRTYVRNALFKASTGR